MYHAFLSPAVQFLFKLSFASGFKTLLFNYTWYFFLWQWEIFLFSRKFVFQQFTRHASCLSKLRRQISCLHRNLTNQQDEVDATKALRCSDFVVGPNNSKNHWRSFPNGFLYKFMAFMRSCSDCTRLRKESFLPVRLLPWLESVHLQDHT